MSQIDTARMTALGSHVDEDRGRDAWLASLKASQFERIPGRLAEDVDARTAARGESA